MARSFFLCFFLLLLAFSREGFATVLAEEEVQAPTLGPVLGRLADSKVRFWIRGPVLDGPSHDKQYLVALRIKPETSEEWSDPQLSQMKVYYQKIGSNISPSPKDCHDYMGYMDIPLKPGCKYDYKCGFIEMPGESLEESGSSRKLGALNWGKIPTYTFAFADPSQKKGTAFAFGSCRYFVNLWGMDFWLQSSDQIFGHIAKKWQDLSLVAFLGDFIYADSLSWFNYCKTYSHYKTLYEKAMSTPNMKKLLATVPCAFMTDDHEIYNNVLVEREGNEGYVRAGLAAYGSYLTMHNPGFKPSSLDPRGSYAFSINSIPAFMVDARLNRSVAPSKRIISTEDMGILKSWLTHFKDAPYKVIFSGVPVFPGYAHNDGEDGDKWRGHKTQVTELLSHINVHKISGVVFCGGDIHESVYAQIQTPSGVCISSVVASPFYWPYGHNLGDEYTLDVESRPEGSGIYKKNFIEGYPYVSFSAVYQANAFAQVEFPGDNRMNVFLYGDNGRLLNHKDPLGTQLKLW